MTSTGMTSIGLQPASGGHTELRELIGIELRSFLVLQMRSVRGSVSVGDLVRAMDADGFVVAGRPSKVISDALRWEVARGRVIRLGRGIYRLTGRIPSSTLRRMKKRVMAAVHRPPAPVRSQPLREHRPLVSADGPWRYRLRHGLAPPRRPHRPRQPNRSFPVAHDDPRPGPRQGAGPQGPTSRSGAPVLRACALRPK